MTANRALGTLVKALGLLVVCGGAHPALALSIYVQFDEALRSSPLVAWVQIESGELMTSTSGRACGARYTARVLHGIKGAQEGQRIQFGQFVGHAIGSQYFVFLQSTASLAPAAVSECRDMLPPYSETDEGMGTLPVSNGTTLGYKPAVELWSTLYEIPAQWVGQRPHTGVIANGLLIGDVQIETEAFYEFLRALAAKQ